VEEERKEEGRIISLIYKKADQPPPSSRGADQKNFIKFDLLIYI
jgi:hypothetical protein